MPAHALDAASLTRYADAVIRTALGTVPGDVVALHAEPEAREFVVALTASAYRAGARHVDVVYSDPRVRRERILGAPEVELGYVPGWHEARMNGLIEAGAAVVTIYSEGAGDLFSDLDPARSALEGSRILTGWQTYLPAVTGGDVRFCVTCFPTVGWAEKVYPELGTDEGLAQLASDFLEFARVSPGDGEGTSAWAEHVETLTRRAAVLTDLALDGLRLVGPGTDLRLGLASRTLWEAAEGVTNAGRRFCANLPTEEVFTSPDAARTSGTFACSLPLVHSGRRLDGLSGEFRDGTLVRLEAEREADRDYFAGVLSLDPGAKRLGEVALLDRTSRIGRKGRVYGSTLLDENAASHIAFGSAFESSRSPLPEGDGSPDESLNESGIHIDVMIGRPELEVTGLRGDDEIPLIAGGDWQI
jgi:aminopeptidase